MRRRHNPVKTAGSLAAMAEEMVPGARANLRGSPQYPEINGVVDFYNTAQGVIVIAQVFGLPYTPGICGGKIFAMHIHAGGSCTGNAENPFADANGHYNPGNCRHPMHAGDLPPLFGNGSYAWQAVLTDRFTVNEIIGKTVIIHVDRDDFTTEPSGDSGPMIACGVIRRV